MPKDNVLTLKLPGDNLVFTRYLYIKDEVKTSLLIAILNKSDDAIFWAYELYYSGFKNELYAFIWQIYYDFFATLNSSFAVYLSKKLGQENQDLEDRLISSIIQNLLIRSFNTDVFILRTISELFESDISEADESVEDFIESKDYRGLALYILNNKDLELEDTYQRVINYFKLTNQQKLFKNVVKGITIKKEIILVANIFALINKNLNQIKKQNFYVRVDPEEVVQYETIEADDTLRPYKILAQACICKIQNNWVNLFQGFRNTTQSTHKVIDKEKYDGWTIGAVLEKYNSLNKWIYHASFSPMWFDRIRSCKGYADYENQEVKFVSEDCEEEFHSKYNLEPDE